MVLGLDKTRGTVSGEMVRDAKELPVQIDDSDVDGLGYLIRDLQRARSRSLQVRIAAHGVSMGQWYFLRALWDEDGLTQRELSHRVGMMEPTTVTALNGMERRGLVRRVRNGQDRRKVNIYLTDKGRELRDILLPLAADVDKVATAGISSEELDIALSVMRRVYENLARE